VIDTTDGWAGVLEAHRAELVRAAELRLRHGADAEDVLHEVLLRLLRSGREVLAVGAPVAYLRRAVANECTSARRRSGRDVLVSAMPDRPGDDGDCVADVCVDRLWLHRALAALSERQRKVIMLTILDDRTDHEVALLLRVRTVTVRTIRRRALARLRQELSDPAAEPFPDKDRDGAGRPALRRVPRVYRVGAADPVEEEQSGAVVDLVLECPRLERVGAEFDLLTGTGELAGHDDPSGALDVAPDVRQRQAPLAPLAPATGRDQPRVAEHDGPVAGARLRMCAHVDGEHPGRHADLGCGKADAPRRHPHGGDEIGGQLHDVRVGRVDGCADDPQHRVGLLDRRPDHPDGLRIAERGAV
jgi:RNA polymerase sigma factor (sigma-70 family)